MNDIQSHMREHPPSDPRSPLRRDDDQVHLAGLGDRADLLGRDAGSDFEPRAIATYVEILHDIGQIFGGRR